MSIFNAIGNTPLVEVNNQLLPNKKGKIFAKLEGCNPGGSVKDRAALFMIEDAIKRRLLTSEKTIIEATSGNTGISLTMLAAAIGYKIKLFMPECVSFERKMILQAMGAEVVLTPGCEKTDGAINAARKLISSNPSLYFMPDQFTNEQNPNAHYMTTAPEILRSTGGEFDFFIAGIGSGGTIMGCARYLKEKNSKIKVIGVEPEKNHNIQGLKNLEESIIPPIFDISLIDRKIVVTDEEAFLWTRKLCLNGFFVGISSGAAFAGAVKIAEEYPESKIVTIFPDRGERYLSTNLFRSFCAKCPP